MSSPSHTSATPEPGAAPSPPHYKVGFLCALLKELQAVRAMFDETLPDILIWRQPSNSEDFDTYYCGRIDHNHVVAACLPHGHVGPTQAAVLAARMTSVFPSLVLRFMVGIAGGLPDVRDDIRLGDVVIGTSIIKYDVGKTVAEGEFKQTSCPHEAPKILSSILHGFNDRANEHGRILEAHIQEMKKARPDKRNDWTYPEHERDVLFSPDYDHIDDIGNGACGLCDQTKVIRRTPREDHSPVVFNGRIGSADQVMRHGGSRDRLKERLEVLAIEMEAGGLEDYRFIVIRGICDYADTHKNKKWQEYAAATAAACAKELLRHFPDAEQIRPSLQTQVSLPIQRQPSVLGTNQPTAEDHDIHRLDTSSRSQTYPPFRYDPVRQSSFDKAKVPSETIVTHDLKSPDESSSAIPIRPLGNKKVPPRTMMVDYVDYEITLQDIPDKSTGSSKTISGRKLEVKIIEHVADEYFKTIRYIALQDSEHDEKRVSLWLPLDKVRVESQVGVHSKKTIVELWFSNCNGKGERTLNGSKQYWSIYDSETPNVVIRLELSNHDLAEALVKQILCISPSPALPYHKQIGIAEGRIQASRNSNRCEIRVFKDVGGTSNSVDTAIFINEVSGDKTLEIFYLGSRLNLLLRLGNNSIDLELASVHQVKYKPMANSSALWPTRGVSENPEGGPKEIDLEQALPLSVNFNFAELLSFRSFVHTITGWCLKFYGNVPVSRSFYQLKKHINEAQVTVWSSGKEIRIIVGIWKDKKTIVKWLSSPLDLLGSRKIPSPSMELQPNRNIVVLKNVRTWKGEYIVRSTMQADSLKKLTQPETLQYKLNFNDATIYKKFVEVLEEYIRLSQTNTMVSTSTERSASEPCLHHLQGSPTSGQSDMSLPSPLTTQRTNLTA